VTARIEAELGLAEQQKAQRRHSETASPPSDARPIYPVDYTARAQQRARFRPIIFESRRASAGKPDHLRPARKRRINRPRLGPRHPGRLGPPFRAMRTDTSKRPFKLAAVCGGAGLRPKGDRGLSSRARLPGAVASRVPRKAHDASHMPPLRSCGHPRGSNTDDVLPKHTAAKSPPANREEMSECQSVRGFYWGMRCSSGG
jgi:hypothetical protein